MEENITTTKYLEKLRNMALLKIKVRESIDILPKELDNLLKSNKIDENYKVLLYYLILFI